MSEDHYSANSPSGTIRLNANGTTLEITGDISPRPLRAALIAIPGIAFACFLFSYAESLLSAQAILGYGSVAYAMWCLNSTKRKTVLRLTHEAVDLEEFLLFTTRRIHARIEGKPMATLDSINWEDWQEDMIRLRTLEGSHLYVLKRHSIDDLRWTGVAIEQWFEGGPHNMALNATGAGAPAR